MLEVWVRPRTTARLLHDQNDQDIELSLRSLRVQGFVLDALLRKHFGGSPHRLRMRLRPRCSRTHLIPDGDEVHGAFDADHEATVRRLNNRRTAPV